MSDDEDWCMDTNMDVSDDDYNPNTENIKPKVSKIKSSKTTTTKKKSKKSTKTKKKSKKKLKNTTSILESVSTGINGADFDFDADDTLVDDNETGINI